MTDAGEEIIVQDEKRVKTDAHDQDLSVGGGAAARATEAMEETKEAAEEVPTPAPDQGCPDLLNATPHPIDIVFTDKDGVEVTISVPPCGDVIRLVEDDLPTQGEVVAEPGKPGVPFTSPPVFGSVTGWDRERKHGIITSFFAAEAMRRNPSWGFTDIFSPHTSAGRVKLNERGVISSVNSLVKWC